MSSETLEDHVTLQRGKTYKSKQLGEPGPVLLGLASIARDGGFRDDNLKTYGGDSPANLILHPGDIYVSLKDVTQSGDLLGSVARLPETVKSGRLTQDTVKLNFKTNVRQSYIYWLLRTPQYRSYCRSHATGTTNLGLAREDFLSFEVPPLDAGRGRLVTLLDSLDDKIELNRRMNRTLESMARALFKSWFVDFDPVHANAAGKPTLPPDLAVAFPAAFIDSPLGDIPAGWEVVPLGNIAKFDKGLSYKGSGLVEDGGLPMVNLGCFAGRGVFNREKLKRYAGDHKSRHRVVPGDLVVANTDMTQNRVIIGSPALVPADEDGDGYLFTHHVYAVRFKKGFEHWKQHVYFTLLKPEFRTIAEGFSTGTTVLSLPRDGLTSYQVVLPPRDVLDRFEGMVQPMLARCVAMQRESRTLAALRDALLPKLLGGEIAVANDGVEVA